MSSEIDVDKIGLNIDIKPTDDFYSFVNGNWIEKNPIPKEESSWGSFNILHAQVEQQLKVILEDITKGSFGDDPVAAKIGDFYSTAMDIEKLNRLKAAPLQDLLKKVDEMNSLGQLMALLGELHRSGVDGWWNIGVEQDERNSGVMALHIYQGGLSLPDRDYYLKVDAKSLFIVSAFKEYISKLSRLAGFNDSNAVEEVIHRIEKSLAAASLTQVELRDVIRQYNKLSISELNALTPHLDWNGYFKTIGLSAPAYVIVGQPTFFSELDRLLSSESMESLRTYLKWHILNSMALFLGDEFEGTRFDFYGRNFNGASDMKPRWRRVLEVINSTMGESLGRFYVKRHFSPEAKDKINGLVDDLVSAYRTRIEALDWMGGETKRKALDKLGKVSKKLGYPDSWKDMTGLEMGTDSYLENYMRVHRFEFDRQIAKVGQPVDRGEWHMPPQTVNAYYSPTMNEIVFPAAILQPPFFSIDADDASNYGGVGGVIGHELTHGFDDQGCLFDEVGNLADWWSEDDKKNFNMRAERLVKQFDAYEPLIGVNINGKLTLGENIADLGGLSIAYDALQIAINRKGGAKEVDSASNRRFFINWAVVWRNHQREELLRLRTLTDPHAPARFRVNGPLSNMPEFYMSFGCVEGDGLWRSESDRVHIW